MVVYIYNLGVIYDLDLPINCGIYVNKFDKF